MSTWNRKCKGSRWFIYKKGSDGQTYASGTVTSAEVSVSGTMNCASGKITVTWKYTVPSLDGDGNEVEGEVQTKTETVEVQ